MASEEQVGLLENVYCGEKEPDSKGSEKIEEVVEGVPLHPGTVVGSSVSRTPWSTGLCACMGSNDEFCSSDLEVCVLGTFAPCILYASNVERLDPTKGTFGNHCLSYTGLLLFGKLLFGCNALAPCLSFRNRSALRRRFNLQGNAKCFDYFCGSCSGVAEGEGERESCESLLDLAIHTVCHRCALCQEGREIRRRVPHPGFFRPYMATVPPLEQVMTFQ
eukprot:c24273_g1_i1 orf=171-827(+)